MVVGTLEEVEETGRVGVEERMVGPDVEDGVNVSLQVQVSSLSPYSPTCSYSGRSRQSATVSRVMLALCRASTAWTIAMTGLKRLTSSERTRCVELAPSEARLWRISIYELDLHRGSAPGKVASTSHKTMVLLCLAWMYVAWESLIELKKGLQ